MRPLSLLPVMVLCLTTHANAQVTLDLHALQALPQHGGGGSLPRVAPPAPHPSGRTQAALPPPAMSRLETSPSATSAPAIPSSETPSAPTSSGAAASGNALAAAAPPTASPSTAAPPAASLSTTAPAAAAPPAIPETVPQTAMITPIAPAPPAAGAPPPPPMSETAATNAAPTVSGLRITFASGQSDLSPESVASIKQLATTIPASDTTSFNVMAYAPGSPDDPSTARRISLSRAMAVRSALVADGVSSTRIYVRAMGAQFGEGPPDRVDVNVLGANGSGPVAAQAAPR